MRIKLLLCALLLATAGAVHAQQPAAPAAGTAKPAAQQLTPEQRAALTKQNQQLTQAAEQVLVMVDHGKVGDIWDAASPVAKQTVSRDAFIKGVAADRARLGTPSGRKLGAITRSISKGGQLPAGYYVNVNFVTRFSANPQPMRELVSFHMDNDKLMRVSGYNVTALPAQNGAQQAAGGTH